MSEREPSGKFIKQPEGLFEKQAFLANLVEQRQNLYAAIGTRGKIKEAGNSNWKEVIKIGRTRFRVDASLKRTQIHLASVEEQISQLNRDEELITQAQTYQNQVASENQELEEMRKWQEHIDKNVFEGFETKHQALVARAKTDPDLKKGLELLEERQKQAKEKEEEKEAPKTTQIPIPVNPNEIVIDPKGTTQRLIINTLAESTREGKGLRPIEITRITGKTPNQITAAIYAIKQKRLLEKQGFKLIEIHGEYYLGKTEQRIDIDEEMDLPDGTKRNFHAGVEITPEPETEKQPSLPKIVINLNTGEVEIDGRKIKFRSINSLNFKFLIGLVNLAKEIGQSIPSSQLKQLAIDSGYQGERPAGNMISEIRRLIEEDYKNPKIIVSRGISSQTIYDFKAEVEIIKTEQEDKPQPIVKTEHFPIISSAEAEQKAPVKRILQYDPETGIYKIPVIDGTIETTHTRAAQILDFLKRTPADANQIQAFINENYNSITVGNLHLNMWIARKAAEQAGFIIHQRGARSGLKKNELRPYMLDRLIRLEDFKNFTHVLREKDVKNFIHLRADLTFWEDNIAEARTALADKSLTDPSYINEAISEANKIRSQMGLPLSSYEEPQAKSDAPVETFPLNPYTALSRAQYESRPYEPTPDETRSEAENSLLEFVTANLSNLNKRMSAQDFIDLQKKLATDDRINTGAGGKQKLSIYQADELIKMFDQALQKIRDEAEAPFLNVNWTPQDRQVWENLNQTISQIPGHDIKRFRDRVALQIRNAESAFYREYPSETGGRVFWIDL